MVIVTKDTKEGQQFSSSPKKVSWERIWTFSGGPFSKAGWPKSNVHTDLDFAKKSGLPSVAVSGTQYQGHLVQLMIDLFGVEWLSHGSMDVKFIGIVDACDILVSKAVVKSKQAEENATTFEMEVWVENQRGEKVLIGSTTGMR